MKIYQKKHIKVLNKTENKIWQQLVKYSSSSIIFFYVDKHENETLQQLYVDKTWCKGW